MPRLKQRELIALSDYEEDLEAERRFAKRKI